MIPSTQHRPCTSCGAPRSTACRDSSGRPSVQVCPSRQFASTLTSRL